MLDNIKTDEEEAGGNINVVLQEGTENSMDVASKQEGRPKENANKKNIYKNQKATDEICWTLVEEGGLEKLNSHEGKISMGK